MGRPRVRLPGKNVQFCIYVPVGVYDEISSMARSRKTSMGHVVRQALAEYTAKEAADVPPG